MSPRPLRAPAAGVWVRGWVVGVGLGLGAWQLIVCGSAQAHPHVVSSENVALRATGVWVSLGLAGAL